VTRETPFDQGFLRFRGWVFWRLQGAWDWCGDLTTRSPSPECTCENEGTLNTVPASSRSTDPTTPFLRKGDR